MSVAPRRACAPARGRRIKKPEKTTATEPTQSEWRWATTRKYAPGSLPKVGRSGTSARIALLQQVRLEGWSTRLSDAAREAAERTVLTHPLRPWTRTIVCSLPDTASRAVADAASGASERPTSQVVSPTTCDNIVNAVKVVDGFKGDVCSHAPPAPPESCKSGLESLWRRTCMTDGSNCDGLEHGAFTPSAVSNPRMQVRSRPTATQWQWRSDRRSTVAKRGRGTTGASADGDTYRCQVFS